MDARDLDDLLAVAERLRAALEGAHGKLRVVDALVLAGFDRSSRVRLKLVADAMRQLGWDRARLRFNGALFYAYARGSHLEREVILDLVRKDGKIFIKRREP